MVWKRRAGGMVRPNAVAALQLITSVNVVGWFTDRSAERIAGFSQRLRGGLGCEERSPRGSQAPLTRRRRAPWQSPGVD